MRVVEVVRPGGPEVLAVAVRAVPTAAADTVVIRSEFAGVNFADLWARLNPVAGARAIPGIEVAGRVHEVGPDVSGLEIGDRVVGLPYFALGGYAEYVEVPATHVVPVPEELALDLAGAIPVNYVTAYIALVRVAQVRPGERVLVHAAAGGVGLAAVQLAGVFGASVIATASKPKHEFLEQLDVVDAVIDYSEADWDDQVREASGGGVDVVLDGIGEDGFRKSLHTLAFGGRLAAFGLTSAMTSSTSPSGRREFGRRRADDPVLATLRERMVGRRGDRRGSSGATRGVARAAVRHVRARRDQSTHRWAVLARRGRRRTSGSARTAEHREADSRGRLTTDTGGQHER
jgi:NADPH:quinone reductase